MVRKIARVRTWFTIAAGLSMLAVSLSALPAGTVVMSQLDSPRGLAFGPEGALYVAEAGKGGTNCQPFRGSSFCAGETGAVSRLWRGSQEQIATGLSSLISPTGDVTGPSDIAFVGRGNAYVTVGFGGDPTLRGIFGKEGATFGTLVQVPASGRWRVVADVSDYEIEHNPGGPPLDSNPFGLLAEPGSHLVTDAGGNSLLRVEANGDISTVAVFPSRPVRSTDAVPTAVVQGPDGAYYVSELSGAPFLDGAANVYRVVPGQAPTIFRSGFKTLIDLAFGADGSLYVLQHATGAIGFGGPGQVIRVAPNGARTVVVSGLTRPTSLVIDGGYLYVTNHGVEIGAGEVLRFAL